MAVIGAVLTGILVPAVFWYQAPVLDLVLGGGALGAAAGVVSDFLVVWNEDPATAKDTNTPEKAAAVHAGVVKPDE